MLKYLLVIFCAFSLVANEPIPDPSQLSATWWTYFEESKDLDQSISQFQDQLKIALPNLNEQNQERANYYIEKIKNNLLAYVHASKLGSPSPAPIKPNATDYTIENLITLFRDVRKKSAELDSIKDDRVEKFHQMEMAQDHLDHLFQSYAKEEAKSQDKFLTGLEIIAYQEALETTKKNLVYLDYVIKEQEKNLEQIKDEVKSAKNKMVVNHVDLKKLVDDIANAENNWKNSRENFKKGETEVAISVYGPGNEREEIINESHSQDLLKLNANQIEAHNQYMLYQMLYGIAHLITEPEVVKPTILKENSVNWNAILKEHQTKVDELISHTQKIVQRFSQLVSSINADTSNPLLSFQKDVLKKAQENLIELNRLQNDLNDSSFVLSTFIDKSSHLMGASESWFLDLIDFSTQTYQKANEWLHTPFMHIGETAINFYSLVRFLLVMFIAVWVSRFAASALTSFAMSRQGIHKSLVYRITRLAQYLILTLGLILALSAVGFDFSNFLLVAGALGVGLGFGLQSIFNNFMSGLIILFESHLKVGDIVELESGIRGEVREINVRSTIISTSDGSDVIVPNAEMISNKVINWTMIDSYRKVHIPFTVPYGTDKDLLVKVVTEAAEEVQTIASMPKASVVIKNFGDLGLEFELSVWVEEKSSGHLKRTISDYYWAVDNVLSKNDIKIPSQHISVQISQD